MTEPRTRTVRHRSSAGWWEIVRATPAPALRGAIVGLCGYSEHGAPLRRLEVPGLRVVVILSLGPSIDVTSGDGPTERRTSFVAALHEAPSVTAHDGVQHGLQLDLAPLAARRLLGWPMGELANRVVDLEDVLEPRASELVERLHDAPGWTERFTLVEQEVARRLAAAPPASPSVAAVVERLTATGGRAPVGRLAADLGWSRRHLGARVRDELGLAPKMLARLVRFQAVTSRLQHEGGARLAEIAQDCGFYDQAHLNRDFRAFAGTTPGAYAARLLPAGAGVAAAALPQAA
jgi:AraC-like DNA-binding protein